MHYHLWKHISGCLTIQLTVEWFMLTLKEKVLRTNKVFKIQVFTEEKTNFNWNENSMASDHSTSLTRQQKSKKAKIISSISNISITQSSVRSTTEMDCDKNCSTTVFINKWYSKNGMQIKFFEIKVWK